MKKRKMKILPDGQVTLEISLEDFLFAFVYLNLLLREPQKSS